MNFDKNRKKNAKEFLKRLGVTIITKTIKSERVQPRNTLRALAAADFAVVEGGLTSAVELAAVGTPFLQVPLSGHVEQESEVAPRLERRGLEDVWA